MEILTSVESVRAALDWRRRSRSVGLVPTGGQLHKGHLTLVRAAMKASDISVVSMVSRSTMRSLMNRVPECDPAPEANYPDNTSEDLDFLESTGVDFVFTPNEQDLFPNGGDMHTMVSLATLVPELSSTWPAGYFDAYATLMTKLLNVVTPDVAFLGEKDYLELVLTRQLAADLNIRTHVNGVPTVRTPDGLALASRNQRLTPEQLNSAPILYQTLVDIAHAIRDGARHFEKLENTARVVLKGAGFGIDFVTVRDERTLQIPTERTERFRVLASVHLGPSRLIDNLSVTI